MANETPARHRIKLTNHMETPTHTAPPVALDRLVRHLGSRLRTRKHAENFAGNTHTASIAGEGTYGAAKNPQAARERLMENLDCEGRLHLFLPNIEESNAAHK